MKLSIISVRLQYEQDLVSARQRARQIAASCGFDPQDQSRIATALSEIARNAYRYAGGGRIEFLLSGEKAPQALEINVSDEGPGVHNLAAILQGRYKSSTGMGLGIQGARRLMDHFRIDTKPGRGTVVTMGKLLPARSRALTAADVSAIGAELARSKPDDAYGEIQQQNQELMRAMEELRRRQEELTQVNRELEDTNRGVVALYAELDEKAEQLLRANQLKSTFLSHMSHEFRTPLNSILALSRILVARMDGPLNAEQEKQVGFISRAAQDLTDMVNDLLDLAKVEAGKIELHASRWELDTVLGTLRGLMRPLAANSPVNLVIEEAAGMPEFFSDEGKVAQILRNLVSNALKFTEAGEVRVWTTYDKTAGVVRIAVQDSGIGIAPEDQQRIFDQYVQVDSSRQRKVRGTGLGLPLSKKLAELLGGSIQLVSRPGEGSTFTLVLPPVAPGVEAKLEPAGAMGDPVLVLTSLGGAEYQAALSGTPFRPVFVVSAADAEAVLRSGGDFAGIIVDVRQASDAIWQFVARAKRAPSWPRVVIAGEDSDAQRAAAEDVDAFVTYPLDRESLGAALTRASPSPGQITALAIDDDDVARYVVTKHLSDAGIAVEEARDGESGLRRAREMRPSVVVLDLVMPGMDGFEVLDALKSDAATRNIPVVVHTSKTLRKADRDRLGGKPAAILGKLPSEVARLVEVIRSVLPEEMSAHERIRV